MDQMAILGPRDGRALCAEMKGKDREPRGQCLMGGIGKRLGPDRGDQPTGHAVFRDQLIKQAQLAILAEEQDTVAILGQISKTGSLGADPSAEAVYAFLRDEFDVETSMEGDPDRRETKSTLLRPSWNRLIAIWREPRSWLPSMGGCV